ERSAYVVPVVAVAVAMWRRRPGAAQTALVVLLLGGTLAGWIALGRVLPTTATSVSPVVEFETPAAERDRLIVYSADAHGLLDRPVLGWGPGNTWSAYLSSATPAQIRAAGRGWADAHDLFLEIAVGAGIPGLVLL